MKPAICGLALALGCAFYPCSEGNAAPVELDGHERGPYPVAATNMEVAPEFADIGDDMMHDALLGRLGPGRFIIDMLQYQGAAWITNVTIPEEPELYGPASGSSMPLLSYLVYPSAPAKDKRSYKFPYFDGMYGVFEDMLAPGEAPRFADPGTRYPLIILSHGTPAHGLYDVQHAQDLASNGYIVAVITYGDQRVSNVEAEDRHAWYLRPLLTRAVLDSILDSKTFGPHIDHQNIGVAGHSSGGFTALAIAGGAVNGNSASVTDERITAASATAPWVGEIVDGEDLFVFGSDNEGLNRIDIPVLCFFGSRDEETLPSFILPATTKLAGPTYVVELVDQPHIMEGPSWVDRNKWELLFFDAFLKHDAAALKKLETGHSMRGGNADIQRFGYQRAAADFMGSEKER